MAWNKAKPKAGRDRKPQLREETDLMEFPANKWVQVRYLGPYNSYVQGWLRIKNTKPGGQKYFKFPKISLDYDPKSEEFTRDICPYRKAGIYMSQRYLANLISRELQEDKPRRDREPVRSERNSRKMLGENWKIKEQGSRTWTPVRVHDMPAGVAQKLQNLSELNTRRKNGKNIAYDITDPRYGMDVMIRYNPKAAGAAKWDVQRAEPTRLTRDEMNYLVYNIENLKSLEAEDRKTAREEWKRLEPNYRPEKREFDKKDSGKSNSRDRDKERRGNFRSRDRDRNQDRSSRNKSERRSERRSGGSNRKRAAGGRRSRPDLDDLD